MCSESIKHRQLKVHMLSVHSIQIQDFIFGGKIVSAPTDPETKIACDECGGIFSSQTALSFHIRLKHKKDVKLLKCEYCDHKEPYESQLKVQYYFLVEASNFLSVLFLITRSIE